MSLTPEEFNVEDHLWQRFLASDDVSFYKPSHYIK
jgi:hypothetical protein